MPRLVLIDPSVRCIGGHHFEYALHVLAAARQAGYEPVLAANRRAGDLAALKEVPLRFAWFSHSTYELNKLRARSLRLRESLAASARTTWWQAASAALRRGLLRRTDAQLRRMSDTLTAECLALVRYLELRPGDQVFVPTVSPGDLPPLAAVLAAERACSRADWHLQFHFPVFTGREPDYAGQQHLPGAQQVQAALAACAAALPRQRLHLYSTTTHLSRQYELLADRPVEVLDYPVNPALRPAGAVRPSAGPLRASCLGKFRAEKNSWRLPQLLGQLWDEYFQPGRVQLVLQARRIRKIPRGLRRVAGCDQPAATGAVRPAVAVARWPLESRQYLDLLARSDIGLLLYDAHEYYARCSGVLVEMLSAGVPVIVTAGCWMADQLAEANYAHRDRLLASLPTVAAIRGDRLAWHGTTAPADRSARAASASLGGGVVVCGLTATAVVRPAAATHLLVRWRHAAPAGSGCYLSITIEQSAGQPIHGAAPPAPLASTTDILGDCPSGRAASTLVPLAQGCQNVRLLLSNAYGRQRLLVEGLELAFLSTAALQTPSCPAGAVGLIAADMDQVPRLLRDMVDHYDHYRRTAAQFAPRFAAIHSPQHLIERLLDSAGVGAAVVPLANAAAGRSALAARRAA
jgi:hypothetical protein